MSIGAELANARRQAGLSIAQVSQRTRIRTAIIEAIERDDFSVCGGDFYARGHIRAIARVAGLDPEPLVREYDGAREAAPVENIPVSRPRRSGTVASTVRTAPGATGATPGTAQTTSGVAQTTSRATQTTSGATQTAADAPGTTPATARTTPGTAQTTPGTAQTTPGRPAIMVIGGLATQLSGPRTAPGVPGRRPGESAPPPRPRHRAALTITLVLLLAAAVGVIIDQVASSGHAAAPGTPAAASRPTVTPRASTSPAAKPSPTASPAGPKNVVISLAAVTEPCWAQLTTPGGTMIYQGIVTMGSSMTWTEGQPVTLILGNPGAVTLTVNGTVRTGLGKNPVTLNLAPGQPPAG